MASPVMTGGKKAVRFLRARFRVAAGRLPAMTDFYGNGLGLEVTSRGDNRISVLVGETTCEFVAGEGDPFYHFALLVPGDRFDQAVVWAASNAQLLMSADSRRSVFDYANWDARACYFNDPAGNVVELIAHRGVEESGTRGRFAAVELSGLSEIGLVGDPTAMARALCERLGLVLWWGSMDQSGGLAFVGERARTLILARPGRGWFPSGRPAEAHYLDVTASGDLEQSVVLERSRYRIRRLPEVRKVASKGGAQ